MFRRHSNTGDNPDAESNPSSRRDAGPQSNCCPSHANPDFHSRSHSNSGPDPRHSATSADQGRAGSDDG